MRLREQYERNRTLIGKFFFEIVIVFIGVTAAFALETARQDRADSDYHRKMIAALIPTLDDTIRHNRQFETTVDRQIAEFDNALSKGERPKLPIYREPGSERPPIRAWEGIISTGAARALDPKLFFDLDVLYTRLESFGERYVRYSDFTERQVLTLGPDQPGIYDSSGTLKPEFAAYVDRLRELSGLSKELDAKASELKAQLSVGA